MSTLVSRSLVLLAGERQQALHRVGALRGGLSSRLEEGVGLAAVPALRPAVQVVQRQFDVARHHGERLVQIVGDPAGDLPERPQLLAALVEIALALGVLAFANISDQGQHLIRPERDDPRLATVRSARPLPLVLHDGWPNGRQRLPDGRPKLFADLRAEQVVQGTTLVDRVEADARIVGRPPLEDQAVSVEPVEPVRDRVEQGAVVGLGGTEGSSLHLDLAAVLLGLRGPGLSLTAGCVDDQPTDDEAGDRDRAGEQWRSPR